MNVSPKSEETYHKITQCLQVMKDANHVLLTQDKLTGPQQDQLRKLIGQAALKVSDDLASL